MDKKSLDEIKRLKELAGIQEEKSLEDELELDNIYLTKKYYAKLQGIINSVTDPQTKEALLIYIAVLEAAWRLVDDHIYSPEDYDSEDIEYDKEHASIRLRGKEITYAEAEENLAALNDELPEDIYDLFLEGKYYYYNRR